MLPLDKRLAGYNPAAHLVEDLFANKIAFAALLNFPLSLLFLFIGTGLALFYSTPPAYDVSDSSRILPIFALHELPAGVRGLLFAGLFAAAMSSLDSAVCAIATTWVVDIRRRPGIVEQAVPVQPARPGLAHRDGLILPVAAVRQTAGPARIRDVVAEQTPIRRCGVHGFLFGEHRLPVRRGP